MRWRSSIQVKILALVAGSLAFTMLSYSYLATSMVAEDKVSGIYKASLTEPAAAETALRTRVERILLTTQMIGILGASDLGKAVFDQYREPLGLEAVVLLRPLASDSFSIEKELGERSGPLLESISRLGWTPGALRSTAFLLGVAGPGEVALAALSFDSAGTPLALAALARVEGALFPAKPEIQFDLVAPDGSVLASSEGGESAPDRDLIISTAKQVLAGSFDKGVRDAVSSEGNQYLVGYRRVMGGLTALTFAHKASAFRSASHLIRRAVALGLALIAIASALTTLLARGLTSRIRQLWLVTQKVQEGDFSVRAETGKSADEIADLGGSFNAMASKIDELMVATAAKARMEKELETANLVQKRFFPKEPLKVPNFQLAGTLLPATECSGDWWHFARIGDFLLVIVGDVTGHGVSSALVTAAAHAMFMESVKRCQLEPEKEPDLALLLRALDRAVAEAGGGAVSMTCLASTVRLSTGELCLVNASHRPLLVYRAGARVSAIQDPKIPPLGELGEVEFTPSRTSLSPGDLILWYTDGLLECESPDKKPWPKRELYDVLSQLGQRTETEAPMLLDELLGAALKHLGPASKALDDDITLVLGCVPRSAQMLRPKEAA